MKTYPSIAASTGQSFREFDAYVFDKVDGSNLRFEWSKKQGWHKFGTRHRMFDETDQQFGKAVGVFKSMLSEPLAKIAQDNRWERLIAFAEFWGPKSFAGVHDPADAHGLFLFDLAPYKKGILGPKEFLQHTENVITTKFLGQVKWTRGYIEKVRAGEVEGVTEEGVVGKAGSGHDLIMAKAKTQAWVDKVLARYGEDGLKLI